MSSHASRPQYPSGIPAKFSPDGVLQRWPGTTTVCHLPPDCPILPGLHAVYAALKAHPVLSKRIHLLPTASWHMTVFSCVREEDCKSGAWPPKVEGGAARPPQTLAEAKQEVTPKIRQLGLELEEKGLAPPYRIRVRDFDPAVAGIGLEVEGATPEEDERLRRIRDLLSERTGYREADHETYGFHISVAYLLRHIDGEERGLLNALFREHRASIQKELALGAVEFCTFENMYAYPREFYLGETR